MCDALQDVHIGPVMAQRGKYGRKLLVESVEAEMIKRDNGYDPAGAAEEDGFIGSCDGHECDTVEQADQSSTQDRRADNAYTSEPC